MNSLINNEARLNHGRVEASRTTRIRRATVLSSIVLGSVAATALAACTPSDAPAPTSQVQATNVADSEQTSAAGTPSASKKLEKKVAKQDACRPEQLDASVDNFQGAAGSTYLTLRFLNTGPECDPSGFPGVSLVDAAGTQIGRAATKEGEAEQWRLAEGATATATLRIVNPGLMPATECAPTPATGIRVFPPNSYESLVIDYPTEACSGVSNILSISPMQPANPN